MDFVIGRLYGKLWNLYICNIRFEVFKFFFGLYVVCIFVDGKLFFFIFVKKFLMLKVWVWNDMVYMWLIILYMGIIVFVNKIKCFEFLLYIMLWYYKYMYSVDCGLMIWRKGRGYWSLYFF